MFVNERVAVSLPLLKSTGEVFTDNPLPLPLGFLRPGLNRIEIEAHVPTPSDESCDTLAARDALLAQYQDWIGSRWWMLPNPTYGGWEGAAFNNAWSLPADLRNAAKREALEVAP